MKWIVPTHADRAVYNKAGKALITPGISPEQFEAASDIVGNWRASHRYPLHAITMSLRARVRRFDKGALVVQRSKRLASIMPKLQRMRLTQIQDIGGCRAVVK